MTTAPKSAPRIAVLKLSAEELEALLGYLNAPSCTDRQAAALYEEVLQAYQRIT